MLGHLGRDDRRGLFAWLASHLTDDGTGLVTTQSRPHDRREPDGPIVETRRLGDYQYRAHHLPSAGGDGYSSRYEVWQGDALIRSQRFTGDWRVLTAQDIAADLPPSLALEPVDDTVALIRRPGA
jgi:hypothetical protein